MGKSEMDERDRWKGVGNKGKIRKEMGGKGQMEGMGGKGNGRKGKLGERKSDKREKDEENGRTGIDGRE